MSKNRQIVLRSRPERMPSQDNFELVETEIPEPGEGEFRIATEFISVDPYLRGMLREGKSYIEPVKVGDVMSSGAVGTVDLSRHPSFRTGDVVLGHWGWRESFVSDGNGVERFDPHLGPISTALGVLGMPGMTAYFGLLDIGQPNAGETVFVSAAAGAVGSLVGQIAKLKGCRVAGSAGSDEKVRYLLDDLRFDGAFNYKSTDDYGSALKEACPGGIDVYFDNVGGPLTDAVFPQLNMGARIVVCGQIDQYNSPEAPHGPRHLWQLITKQARAEGFLVFQFKDRYPEAQREIAGWLRDGKITYRETIAEGIENTPAAFIGLFKGENIGKQLVRVRGE